jgi:hypothetical protein
MPAIHTTDAYAVDRAPIETIELDGWVVNKHLNGEPARLAGTRKAMPHNRAAGEPPKFALRAERSASVIATTAEKPL